MKYNKIPLALLMAATFGFSTAVMAAAENEKSTIKLTGTVGATNAPTKILTAASRMLNPAAVNVPTPADIITVEEVAIENKDSQGEFNLIFQKDIYTDAATKATNVTITLESPIIEADGFIKSIEAENYGFVLWGLDDRMILNNNLATNKGLDQNNNTTLTYKFNLVKKNAEVTELQKDGDGNNIATFTATLVATIAYS